MNESSPQDAQANVVSLSEGNLRALLPSSIADDPGITAAAVALIPHLRALALAVPNLLLFGRLGKQNPATLLPPLARLTQTRGGLEPVTQELAEQLAWQFHVDFREVARTTDDLAAMVMRSIPWHRIKGTPASIKRALALFGIGATIEEHMPSRHWATYQLGLSGIESVEEVRTAVRVAREMQPARCDLFRVYNDIYDRRPIIPSYGPVLSDGWLSYWSGVNVDVDGDDVIVSLGTVWRLQAEAYLTGDMAASFGTESIRGSLIPYLDRFIVGRSRLFDVYPRNNPFVITAIFSILWADRATLARQWRGEWDARRWLDYTGFDRKLPRWRMERRPISRAQLVPSWSKLADINSRLGPTFAVVIDTPPRLETCILSGYKCGRRELRLHEMFIHSHGLLMSEVRPRDLPTTNSTWLAARGELADPERVLQVMDYEQAIKLEPFAPTTWTALPCVLALRSEILEPEIPLISGGALFSGGGRPLPDIIPQHFIHGEQALRLATPGRNPPAAGLHLALATQMSASNPSIPSAALTTFSIPHWSGIWTTPDRTWGTAQKLSVQ